MNRESASEPLHRRFAFISFFGAAAALAVLVVALVITHAPFWSVLIVAAGCAAGVLPTLVWRRTMPWPRRRRGGEAGGGGSSREDFIVPVEPPAPRLKFEGRVGELKAIHDRLKSAGKDRSAIVCITGAPGIGKTALAVQYASSYRNSFPDGQIYTSFEHAPDSDSAVYEVLGQFLVALQRPNESVPSSLESRRSRYLELTAGRRLLVILDNACHPHCVRGLMPGGQSSATIITARNIDQVLVTDVLSRALSIELEPLSRDAGIRLLASEIGASEVESSNGASVKMAGSGHPLAIRLAAIALTRRPYWSIDDGSAAEADIDDETAVNANLELIYPLLTAEERKALRCMALLDKPSFAAWEIAALAKMEEPDAVKVADNLARVDLVRRTSGGPVGIVRFKVNDHILPYLRDKVSADTLAQKRADGREVLERAAADRRRDGSEILFDLNSTAWALKESGKIPAAFDLLRSAVASAQENRQPQVEALALATISDLRLEIGNMSGARELAEAALRADQGTGPARALRCLGVIRWRQGELGAARDLLDGALGEARRIRDVTEEIKILIEQAGMFALAADKSDSLLAADRAVELCAVHDDYAGLLPLALYGKSRALLGCRRPDSAKVQLDRAVAIVSVDQPLARAWMDLLYSEVALKLDRRELAIASSSRAIDGFGLMSHRYGVACSRLGLAKAYAAGGDDHLAEALAAVRDALETLQNCEDPVTERSAERLLAELLGRGGQADDDLTRIQAIAAPFRKLGDGTRTRARGDELASNYLASALRHLRFDKPRQSAHWQRSAG